VFILGTIVLAVYRAPAVAYFAAVPAILAGLAVLSHLNNSLLAPAAARLALGSYFAVTVSL
jgi:hypothetical protein